jgi:hypothetical protein
MVEGEPECPPPGPFGRRITELFNEWPEGDRAAAEAAGRRLALERDAEAISRTTGPLPGAAAG